ncbi:MAG: hypothetical protein ACYCS1_08380 [Gammaproteobacteria bacterium]
MRPVKPAPEYTLEQLSKSTHLGLIVVQGAPLPIRLEILKTALVSPWSTAWKDRNQIVCRLREPVGTHLSDRDVLRCATNREHFQRLETLQTDWFFGVLHMNQLGIVRDIDPGKLRAILAKVPPAGSSYTLKVMNHGHVVSEWVMHKGQLVKAWMRPVQH